MNAQISREEITDLRRRADLAAFVRREGVVLVRDGLRLIGAPCPFHRLRAYEKPDWPCFVVHECFNMYHCRVCGVRGDVFRFVEFIRGVSFREAYEIVRQGIGADGASDA